MKIVNENVRKDIETGTPIKLNLGSGPTEKKRGFYNLDYIPMEGVDIVADLNKPLDRLPNNSISELRTSHTLEHVVQLLPLMSELYRITQPNGRITIIVPHYSNPYYYSDPTHVRFFGLYSMYYFVAAENQSKYREVPVYYSDARFTVDSIRFTFYETTVVDKLVAPVLSRLINSSFRLQDFYERRLANFFHASEIIYILRPDKK